MSKLGDDLREIASDLDNHDDITGIGLIIMGDVLYRMDGRLKYNAEREALVLGFEIYQAMQMKAAELFSDFPKGVRQ